MNKAYPTYITSLQHHHPFGMMMLGRNWETGSDYKFGFNGKESDSETYGAANIYDYGFRIYNPRLGKFLSVDPLSKSYPWYTSYQFAGNKPIVAIDLDGLEEYFVIRWYDNANQLAFSTVIKVPNAVQVTDQNGSLYLELRASNPGDASIFQNVFGVTPAQAQGLMSTAGTATMAVFSPANEFGTSPTNSNPDFKFSEIINKSASTPYLFGSYQAPSEIGANGLRPYERDIVNSTSVVAYDDDDIDETGAVSAYIQSIQTRTVLFDITNMVTLDAGDQSIVDAPIRVLSRYPSLTATIEGNTDSNMSPAHNDALGMRRATAVSAYMQLNSIDGGRLTLISNGERNATGTTAPDQLNDPNAKVTVNYPALGN